MEDYDWLKLIFIFVAFAEAFLFGLLPVKVKSCRNSVTALGIANAFAGGVFIAIALLHIMPEQVESWGDTMCDRWIVDNPGGDKDDCPDAYPLPFLLLVLGYTLILILDKVVFDSHALFHGDDHGGHQADILRKSLTKASLVVREQME